MSPVQVGLLLVLAQPPSPTFRPITSPGPVPIVGVETRSDGGTAAVAPTPGFALADLDLYDRDVKTAFSLSAPTFPAESLVAARAERSRAWLGRAAVDNHGPLMDAVLRAEVEGAAGEDGAADRTFAAALARAPRGRRSYVLARAVMTFANDQRDDSALARRLSVAERYLARLLALPPGGYVTAYDSLALVDRTYICALAVLAASARLGDTERVAAHTTDALAALGRYTGLERVNSFTPRGWFPVEAVATVLLGQSHGPVRLDSLAARVLEVVTLTPAELASAIAEGRTGMPRAIAHDVVRRFQLAALLGRDAPALTAHAWLNTPDSAYAPAPRTHDWHDGTVRALYFTLDAWYDGAYRAFPMLSRVHDAMAPWGQVVVVTHTDGHAGSDLVDPPAEVAWLTTLFRDEAHLTPVIALWAGAKEPAPHDGQLPAPPPLDPVYVEPRYPVFVVDGHRIVRGFFPLDTRRDETALSHAMAYLHAEALGDAALMPRPASLVPPHAR